MALISEDWAAAAKIREKCFSMGETVGVAASSCARKDSLTRLRNFRDSRGDSGSGGWKMEEKRLWMDLVRETRGMLVGLIVWIVERVGVEQVMG